MGLDRERVVRSALMLLNQVGLEGMTLRKLAAELGVKAPALYWHFENKQALLDEMATTMLRDLLQEAPVSEPDGIWQEFVVAYSSQLRAMLLKYRDGARVFSGTYLTDDSLLGAMEIPLRLFVDVGFTLREAVHGWSTLYAYTIGYVIEEQAVRPVPDVFDERYDPARRAARINAERYPLTVAAGEEAFGRNMDGRYQSGLRLIVSGMEQQLEAARRGSSPSGS